MFTHAVAPGLSLRMPCNDDDGVDDVDDDADDDMMMLLLPA
jgi:hypothetical protein